MCGRYTLSSSAEIVAEMFGLMEAPELAPRHNIAPTQAVPAIVRHDAGETASCRMLRWGLVPSWAKDPSIGARMINARAETVATKPSFRAAFRKRRCLIPADGFYEWQKLEGRKQPHYIHLKEGRPFAFAGLWEHWERDGASIDTCTIITTQPNDLMVDLHNRMPVILRPADYDSWLDPRIQQADELRSLLRPYPANEMTAYPVSTLVNSPSNDSEECTRAVEQPGEGSREKGSRE